MARKRVVRSNVPEAVSIVARLRTLGARALSDRELLALVLTSGGAGAPARVAMELPEVPGGSLRQLSQWDLSGVERRAGLDTTRAARLVAALELGRRGACEIAMGELRIQGPGDVYERLGPRLRSLVQEEFHALLLDSRHQVLGELLLTRGTLDASLVHPREVFRAAILAAAHSVIVAHNHPSGDPTPSPDDRTVTRELVAAGKVVGIEVLDHVVVGGAGYISFREQGLM